ncbi:MAG TPA: amino acid ABC transporter substrate-binding protein [Fastidiosipila sp.]|jgi:polar amino acid transport system substrate-binding protein|nr:amino acid ABC transporter substrate-binding protein [Fastidiosipila sp.]
MKRKRTWLLLLLCLTLLVSACAGNTGTTEKTTGATESASGTEEKTDDSWSKIEAKGKLIMGLDDNFPPMGFRDEKNEIVGFDVDLAKEVTKRLGIELDLLPIDWSMKQNELDAGNVDLLWNGYSFTPERDADNTLSTAYLANDQVVIVLSKSGVTDLAGLAGKTLAVQEGSSAQQALDAAADFKASLGSVVPFRDNVTAFLDVESGSSDALLIDKVVGEYYIAQKDEADYTILGESLAPETYVIGFRKGEVAFKDKIEETLRAMKEDGKLAEIATEWFGSDVTIFK